MKMFVINNQNLLYKQFFGQEKEFGIKYLQMRFGQQEGNIQHLMLLSKKIDQIDILLRILYANIGSYQQRCFIVQLSWIGATCLRSRGSRGRWNSLVLHEPECRGYCVDQFCVFGFSDFSFLLSLDQYFRRLEHNKIIFFCFLVSGCDNNCRTKEEYKDILRKGIAEYQPNTVQQTYSVTNSRVYGCQSRTYFHTRQCIFLSIQENPSQPSTSTNNFYLLATIFI